MAIQNDNTLVTKGDLKALYSDKIAPYLGQNLALKTNVSDYYSTDEKVVGVWIDGRPVYQKTVNFGAGPNATTKRVAHNISNMNRVCSFVCIGTDGNTFWTLNWPPIGSGSSAFAATTSVDKTNVTIQSNGDSTSENYLFTIQYTKTTDAANSAVTTPGCYDINFPNTWPTNQEVYFGNGLYGYRKTGNMPAISSGSATTAILYNSGNLTSSSRIIQTGGSYDVRNAQNKPCVRSLGTTYSPTPALLTAASVTIAADYSSFAINIMMGSGGDTSVTTGKYDIWVTYTK